MNPSIDYDRVAYEGGATRSPMKERFDLIPHSGLQAIARRFAYGAERHGDRNWESGGAEFAETTINHLMKHVALFSQHRRQEDLDALLCNGVMLAEFKRRELLPEKE